METPEPLDHGTQRRRGTKIYLFSSIVAQFCALARYTLMARLVGPEQLGLAATVVITAQFFDAISDAGSDRFLIQDRQGNTVRVQKLLQLGSVLRGIFITAALILCAVPLAGFYQAPELVRGFALLAVAPLIAGFIHLDMRRVQRGQDFRPEAHAQIAAESISLLVLIAAAWVTRDFTAMIYGLIARSLVLVVASHMLAERRYALGYAPEDAPRFMRFALPLFLNGAVLYFSSQGDRVLIGNQMGLTALGHYSAISLLIYYPRSMIQRFLGGIHLPLMSAQRDDPQGMDSATDALGSHALLITLAVMLGFAAIAPSMAVILYGPEFQQPVLAVAMIGVLQCARFLRMWPVWMAFALGRSKIVLIDNLVRILALPLAFLGIDLVGGLMGMMAAFLLGELLALGTTIILINRLQGHGLSYRFDRVIVFLIAAATVLAAAYLSDEGRWLEVLALLLPLMLVGGWVIRRDGDEIRKGLAMARQMLTSRRAQV
jgi:O-antigen/teichoic acid export membrane protein